MTSPPPALETTSRPLTVLYALAAFVVVTAGLQAAAGIITPVLLAGFLAIIFAPALLVLRDRGVPTLLALPLLSAPVIVAAMMLSLVLEASFTTLQRNMSTYQRRLEMRKHELVDGLRRMGVDIPEEVSFGELDPSRFGRWTAYGISMLRSIVTLAALVLILLLITLLEAAGLSRKFEALGIEVTGGLERMRAILLNVRYYLLLKTLISGITGLAVFVLLWLLEIDFPVLWGLTAFALNYVPNIGSILAAVPAVTLAWIMNGGPTAVTVAAGYIAINVVIGSILEPMWMGRGVGLSPLVVVLSLLYWGWVLGPIGMLLSVPLTMTCKIVLEADASTRWIAVLLGPNLPAGKT